MHIKGVYFDGKIWVRDEHSDAEAVSMKYLPKLLEVLGFCPDISLPEITREINKELYFDIHYRCDFNAPEKPSDLNDSQPCAFEPKQETGCDLAFPVKFEKSDNKVFKVENYFLLGLDPFAVVDEKNNIRVDNDWSNNHLTGKNMTSNYFLKCKPKPTFLYAGVLHGKDGGLLPMEKLKEWCAKMGAPDEKSENTFVVLAPVAEGESINWFGLFQRGKGTGIGLQWEPLTRLVNDDKFWEALKETGAARNTDIGGAGDVFDGVSGIFD
ncbi:hypothetical protein [Dickeya zeae]|uniref:hypothetical protein n=1 Tax=Dickeya zeae TaxID=204042 RepID=UPI00030F4AB0|nr:hypothetical protein [Dickeya zeae]AJC64978.1 hypothetical protein W909_02190 [Dickeya zeae EC1]